MSETIPVCEKRGDTIVDKEVLEIWYDSDFKNSEATLIFLKTFVELMEKGWTPLSLDWCSTVAGCKIFYCKNKNGQVVSGIVCFYIESARQGWVLLSFTDPLWRKKGLNKILFPYVEKYMKNRGAKSIAVSVHKENMPRLIASQKNGLEIKYVSLIKDI